jgi:hypothetical protein
MKAVAALIIAMLSAAIVGCGPEAVPGTQPITARPLNLRSAPLLAESIARRAVIPGASSPPGAPARYRTIEYSAEITNVGTPGSYTAFVRIKRTVTIRPSSAARITTFADGPPAFTTPTDRARWQAAGSPSLAPAPAGGSVLSLPAGQFSFIPQGTTLTYRQATSLPSTPQALSAQLLSHLRAFAGPHPPANLELEQLGYLIAVAPLTAAARAAAWRVLAALPGLHLCGSGTGPVHRPSLGLCAESRGDQTEVLVSTHTGTVLTVEDRLLRPSPMYPMVFGGSLISSVTFLAP